MATETTCSIDRYLPVGDLNFFIQGFSLESLKHSIFCLSAATIDFPGKRTTFSFNIIKVSHKFADPVLPLVHNCHPPAASQIEPLPFSSSSTLTSSPSLSLFLLSSPFLDVVK